MAEKQMEVKVGSDLYKKITFMEDFSTIESLRIKIFESIDLVRRGNLMGGGHGEFILKLYAMLDEVSKESSKFTNKLIGIDEDTEVVIVSDKGDDEI